MRSETRWNTQVSRSELVSDEPVRHGSAFKTVNRGKEFAATIGTYERPSRLVFDVTGQAMDITVTVDFRSEPAGTALAAVYEMSPKGFLKAIFPLMAPVVRRGLAEQSRNFKAFCES
jgi:hypothetical protein